MFLPFQWQNSFGFAGNKWALVVLVPVLLSGCAEAALQSKGRRTLPTPLTRFISPEKGTVVGGEVQRFPPVYWRTAINSPAGKKMLFFLSILTKI